MSSPAPNRSNGYLWSLDAKINKENLDNVTGDIHQRLSSLETSTTINADALEDLATELVEDTYNNTVAPQLAATQQLLTNLSDNIELAEDALLLLQQGGILAENVSLADIAGLTAEDAQAAFAELTGALALKASDAALADKASLVQLAEKLGNAGGTLTGSLTAPSLISSASKSDTPMSDLFIKDANNLFGLRHSLSNDLCIDVNNSGAAVNALKATQEGVILKPSQPGFSARGYSSRDVNGNHIYAVTDFNEGNHYNPATGIFTAPETGVYAVHAFVGYKDTATYLGLWILVNGSNYQHAWTDNTIHNNNATLGGPIKLIEGDTLNVGSHPSYTFPHSTTHYSGFSAYLMG